MPIDHGFVAHLAELTGFRGLEIEQVLHLKQILKAIHDDPDLGPAYTLIGGTAINLFDAELPRLSVDIDIEYEAPEDGYFTQELVSSHLDILRRLRLPLT